MFFSKLSPQSKPFSQPHLFSLLFDLENLGLENRLMTDWCILSDPPVVLFTVDYCLLMEILLLCLWPNAVRVLSSTSVCFPLFLPVFLSSLAVCQAPLLFCFCLCMLFLRELLSILHLDQQLYGDKPIVVVPSSLKPLLFLSPPLTDIYSTCALGAKQSSRQHYSQIPA